MTGHSNGGSRGGNKHEPERCQVTVYHCCQHQTAATTNRKPEYGHQCHDAPVKDGLCLKHLGDKIRLNKSFQKQHQARQQNKP